MIKIANVRYFYHNRYYLWFKFNHQKTIQIMIAEMTIQTPSFFAATPDEKALRFLNIHEVKDLHFQLTPTELIEHALKQGEGQLTDTGALMCTTGRFTGRSPKDRYIVKDALTESKVDWGSVNIPFDEALFDRLHRKMCHFVEYQKVYVRYAIAGADPAYQLKLCILTTSAWQNLFCDNMFLRPTTAVFAHEQTPDKRMKIRRK